MMSSAMYAKQDPCPISEALEALAKAVESELAVPHNQQVDDVDGLAIRKRRSVLFA